MKLEAMAAAASGSIFLIGSAAEELGWWKVVEAGGMLAIVCLFLYSNWRNRQEDARANAERDRLFLEHNKVIAESSNKAHQESVAELAEVAAGQMQVLHKVIEVLTETKAESKQNTQATGELRQAIQQMSLELARKQDRPIEGVPPSPKPLGT